MADIGSTEATAFACYGPQLQRLRSTELFNMLQDGPRRVLAIDTRTPETTATGEMADLGSLEGALSLRPVAQVRDETAVALLERISSDVLSPEEREHFEGRTTRTVCLMGSVTFRELGPKDWTFQLARLLTIERKTKPLYVLEDPIEQFLRLYPFLSTKPQPISEPELLRMEGSSAEDDDLSLPESKRIISYPNEIIPQFLYLGNCYHGRTAQIIGNLRITHVVDASQVCAEHLPSCFLWSGNAEPIFPRCHAPSSSPRVSWSPGRFCTSASKACNI